jgi:Rrf2 family iron-sulfur cluster assembly transcriptional regulator
MILSKATGYGILALAYLSKQPKKKLCGLEEIASHEGIPPVFLRKVLGELRRHRLVRSVKGIHGGYELARIPQAITLWDVVRLLDTDPDLDLCVLGRGVCSPETACPLHEDWNKVREEWVKMLQSKTISELGTTRGAFTDPNSFVSVHQGA